MWDDDFLHDRIETEHKLLQAVPLLTKAPVSDRWTITNSERQTFLSCRQRHAFRYVQRLRSPSDSSALRIGKLVHAGVQHVLERLRDGQAVMLPDKAGDDARAQLCETLINQSVRALADLFEQSRRSMIDGATLDADDLYMAQSLVKTYVNEHVFSMRDDQVVDVEWTFSVPYPGSSPFRTGPQLQYAGQLDSLWRRGDQWVLEELKTTGQNMDIWQERMELDTQTRGYAYALHMAKHVPYENMVVRWVVLQKKIAKEPLVLKSGLVSTDKRQQCTAPMYSAALLEQAKRGKEMTESQAEFLQTLPAALDIYRVFEVPVRQAEIVRWGKEAFADAQALMDANEWAPGYVPVRNMDVCTKPGGYCEYKQACVEGDVVDPSWLSMNIFRVADCKHEELVKSED